MGSDTSQTGVPPSGESCSAEMQLRWLVVLGKALQGWGGTMVFLCQLSCVFSRALLWILVPRAFLRAPCGLRRGCGELGQIFLPGLLSVGPG